MPEQRVAATHRASERRTRWPRSPWSACGAARRIATGGGLAVLLLAALASVVQAHAQLVASEPRDGSVIERGPERVRLLFNEPIEPEFYAVEVYSSERARVDRRDARIPPNDSTALEAGLNDLAPGTYTVVWRVLSIDGHVVRGVFAFTVGVGVAHGTALRLDLEAGAAPGMVAAAVRWLTFLCAFALVGGLGFLLLILWPALRAARLAAGVADGAARRFLWVAWPAVILLLALSLAALLLQAAEVTGVSLAEVLNGRAITRLLTATKYGALWLGRMACLLGLLAIVVVLTVEHRPRAWGRWGGLALGAGLFLMLSASGHASAVPNRTFLAVGADSVHLVAGAIWVGGLIQLATALPATLGALHVADRRMLLGYAVRRFSLVAGASVAVLVLTGLYSSLAHVPSWLAMLDTAYGAALSGKLILIAPLLGVAAVNLLVIRPRFARAARLRRSAPEDAAGPRLFFGLVLGEALLAIGVLAVTGVLTGLPPATTASLEGRQFRETARAGGLAVTLAISPNQAGTNDLDVTVLDANGQPARAIDRVALAMSHQEMDMGTREATAEATDAGRYRVQGSHLSMSGRWQIVVRARRADGAEQTLQFEPVVSAAPGATRPSFSPGRILLLTVTDPSRERTLPVNPLFGAALLFGTTAALLFLREASAGGRQRGAPVAGAVLLAIALLIGGTAVASAYRRSLPNPVAADAASLTRGRAVYDVSCATCHGDEGRGDGPLGVGLRPRPADFRVHMAAGHTDAELFNWVTNGVDGTAMPAFGPSVPEQERWDVINYIRTFAAPQR